MLHNNLATRPFYNQKLVRYGIGAGVVVVLLLTIFNVAQLVRLSARNTATSARAEQAHAQTRQAQQDARRITDQLNRGDVSTVVTAAREANALIDRRAFSWTELFNRLETTLPPNVRVASVQPQVDRDGRMLIAAAVVARRVEDLHAFMDRLEASGGLHDVISRADEVLDDGSTRSVVQGYYQPLGTPPTVPGNSTADAPVVPSPRRGAEE